MQAMSIRIFLILFILIFIYPASLIAGAERRQALVIGNGGYISSPLKNAVNDAADIASNLQKLGFSVILKKNVSHQEMEDAILEFGEQLKKGGVGLFFYAGHGVQKDSRNYLLPIGARINKDTDIKFQAVDAELVLAEMGNAGNNLNIVILDACRDNPFSKSFRSSSRGLAIISDAPKGTFITYSTSPGKVAADGSGRNSPYTESLIKYMNTKGLPIEEVFKEVRKDLGRKTGGQQVPWELSSLEGQFYFSPGKLVKSDIVEEERKQTKKNTNLAIAKHSAQSIVTENTGMEFVFVRGGCFQMGDLWGDGTEDEKPVDEVCVDDFYIGKYEVTMGQFKAFITETGYRTDAEKGGYGCGRRLVHAWDSDPKAFWHSPGFAQSENHPVVCVSDDDAEAFAGWISRKEGRNFRLPTEAEWEYVARSKGKNYKYGWGNGSVSGNIADESLKKIFPKRFIWDDYNDGYVFTAPVGQFMPNDLGVYDMTGNVWEYCSDGYDTNYYKKSPRNNPIAPHLEGATRSVRGGSWLSIPQLVRVASRAFFDPAPHIDDDTGFRLLMITK